VIVWDTGPLVAAIDVDDKHHEPSIDLMRRTPGPLLVPYPVLVEVCYLLEREKGTRAELAFLRSVHSGQVSLIPLNEDDVSRTIDLVGRYADLPLGMVDASVVAVAERLDAGQIATFDHRHFGVVRPRHLRAFTLLPE